MPIKIPPLKSGPTLRIAFALIAIAAFIASAAVLRTEDPAPADLSGAAFRDASLPLEDRVEDLLARMTVAEKIGQMAMVERKSVYDREDKPCPTRACGGTIKRFTQNGRSTFWCAVCHK